MPLITNAADMANLSLGAVKNSAKVYNFHAKQLDDTMHIADTLNEKLHEIDPNYNVSLPSTRKLRIFEGNRGKLANPDHRPILVPRKRPKVSDAAPVRKLTAEERRNADMERWRAMRDRQRYMAEHGRYEYERAMRMGKFGSSDMPQNRTRIDSEAKLAELDTGTREGLLRALEGNQGAVNSIVGNVAQTERDLQDQQLERITKMRRKNNEETAPGTNQHYGMDPNRSMMKKMGEETHEERLLRLRKELGKTAASMDSLGKMHSPAAQGGGVDAPMPQTNYAKNTLDNEYANRLNKQQLYELSKTRNQNQNQNPTNQSSTSTTTTSSGTTTTTTVGLSNSGLMAALSLGS